MDIPRVSLSSESSFDANLKCCVCGDDVADCISGSEESRRSSGSLFHTFEDLTSIAKLCQEQSIEANAKYQVIFLYHLHRYFILSSTKLFGSTLKIT